MQVNIVMALFEWQNDREVAQVGTYARTGSWLQCSDRPLEPREDQYH